MCLRILLEIYRFDENYKKMQTLQKMKLKNVILSSLHNNNVCIYIVLNIHITNECTLSEILHPKVSRAVHSFDVRGIRTGG